MCDFLRLRDCHFQQKVHGYKKEKRDMGKSQCLVFLFVDNPFPKGFALTEKEETIIT